MGQTRGLAGAPKVTLVDVARAAGVSRATVSVVMRGQTGASQDTRERVLAVAKVLDYRPDVRARSLASASSRLIGVVFRVESSFHVDVLEGLYDEAEKLGYNLVLGALTRARDESRAIDELRGYQLEAIIMLGPVIQAPSLAGAVPLAVVGWEVDDETVDVVRTSDTSGMALAIGHLTALGHRSVAHLDGGAGLIAVARRGAYLAAMEAKGLHCLIRVLPGGESAIAGADAARAMLASPEQLPTAIIAYNDATAVGAMRHLEDFGIDVPGDISVIGYDDSHLARGATIGLTSVAQDPHEMARLAVRQVVARAQQRTRLGGRTIVLEPQLVVRNSTAAAPEVELRATCP